MAFLDFVHQRGLYTADAYAHQQEILSEYKAKRLPYDRWVEDWGRTWALGLQGQEFTQLSRAAQEFFETFQVNIYPQARPLVEAFKANGFRTVDGDTLFPLLFITIACGACSGFHSLIALTMAICVTWFFRGTINPTALLGLIPAILILFLISWCLAIIGGFAYAHFPDTNHLLEIGLQIFFYATPIMIRASSFPAARGRVFLVWDWNPCTYLIAMIRVPITEGVLPSMQTYAISLGFLAVVAMIAFFLLRKLERTLVFWV